MRIRGYRNQSEIRIPKSQMAMAAIVQGLERQIVVLDVVGSIPTSRPTLLQTSPKISGNSRFEQI
jgi:hypothetical protein